MWTKFCNIFKALAGTVGIVLALIITAIIGVAVAFVGFFLFWGLIGIAVVTGIFFIIWAVIDEAKD